MHTYAYELVGGHPVLDFLNTIHDRNVEERLDRLVGFGEVIGFAAAAGVLRPAEARRLDDAAGAHATELRLLRELRERLARVFEAVASSSTPAPADLERLAHDFARAAAVSRLHPTRGTIVRTVDVGEAGAAVIRWRLVDAAVALLASETITDVKSCPSCGWFFLDTSKNGSRRWCSMRMCGAAVKARRYYSRRRG